MKRSSTLVDQCCMLIFCRYPQRSTSSGLLLRHSNHQCRLVLKAIKDTALLRWSQKFRVHNHVFPIKTNLESFFAALPCIDSVDNLKHGVGVAKPLRIIKNFSEWLHEKYGCHPPYFHHNAENEVCFRKHIFCTMQPILSRPAASLLAIWYPVCCLGFERNLTKGVRITSPQDMSQ